MMSNEDTPKLSDLILSGNLQTAKEVIFDRLNEQGMTIMDAYKQEIAANLFSEEFDLKPKKGETDTDKADDEEEEDNPEDSPEIDDTDDDDEDDTSKKDEKVKKGNVTVNIKEDSEMKARKKGWSNAYDAIPTIPNPEKYWMHPKRWTKHGTPVAALTADEALEHDHKRHSIKEDAEDIQELSDDSLERYAKKADKDNAKRMDGATKRYGEKREKPTQGMIRKYMNRKRGVAKAVDTLEKRNPGTLYPWKG